MKLRLALALCALATPLHAQSLPTPNLGSGTKLNGAALTPTATKGQGTSVADPGSGNLEWLLPVQTVTGPSKVFGAADLYKETRRSNSGAAMTDTFPGTSTSGLANGTTIQLNNVDTGASITVSAGAGTTVNGGTSVTVGPGRSTKWVYDSSATNWRPTMNSLTSLLAANGLSDLANVKAARGSAGLNIESGTGHGDSAYTVLPTDRWVYTNAAFTASRTWTLPVATALNAGAPLVIDDLQGTVTATNTLVVLGAGSDTINGGTSFTIDVAGGRLILFSDGVSKWTARLQRPYGTAAGNAIYLDSNARLPPVDGSALTNLSGGNLTNTSVTYSKLQQVAANKLLGNPTASATNAAEIALPLAQSLGGTGDSGTGSASYTPIVTWQGGTPTGGTPTRIFRWKQLTAKFIWLGYEFSIETTSLNGATGVTFSLPNSFVGSSAIDQSCTGQDPSNNSVVFFRLTGGDTETTVVFPGGPTLGHFYTAVCYFEVQ